jgi:hypothetical protein
VERPLSFGDRFGYLLWLKHLADGEAPSYRDVGKAVERSGEAVGAWRVREDAPPDYRVHEPLAGFFGAAQEWVVTGKGEPPEPELWKFWIRYRRAQPKPVPAGAAKQVTRADVAAGKKTPTKKVR